MPQLPSLTIAAIVTVFSNAVAVAVAFGVHLDQSQRETILAFVGSFTTLVFAIYAAVHVKHVSAAVTLAQTAAAPPIPQKDTTSTAGPPA